MQNSWLGYLREWLRIFIGANRPMAIAYSACVFNGYVSMTKLEALVLSVVAAGCRGQRFASGTLDILLLE